MTLVTHTGHDLVVTYLRQLGTLAGLTYRQMTAWLHTEHEALPTATTPLALLATEPEAVIHLAEREFDS